MKKTIQVYLVCVLVCLTLVGQAESNFQQDRDYTEINHNWSKLSQDQYVKNLVACELKVQEHKWSKNIWPEANANPKPTFSEVVEPGKILQQVLDNLKMQSILADRFNTPITTEMLQHDLDRMAGNTKDAKGLKSLFELFDNNPDTIAQCISRPYLVKQKIKSNYDFNSEIHADTKSLAKIELKSTHSDELKAQVNLITFEIEQEDQINENSLFDSEEQTIKLSPDKFIEKKKLLGNNTLQEKSYGFIKTEIIDQNATSIHIKTLVWEKSPFDLWLQQQNVNTYIPTLSKTSLKLPVITGANQLTGFKAGVLGNTWESKTFEYPKGREFHTSVWSGSEMIVWGGYDGINYLNTGVRYEPASDSWTSINLGSNAPSARRYHTAIWTGSEMIIWGGNIGVENKNTGGRYDPINDIWTATSLGANVPNGRYEHTAIWTGDEMIVWGGRGHNGALLNTGGRYDPTNDSWMTTSIGANVPNGRFRHTAIWSGSEMIVWGGANYGVFVNTGGRYDPTNDSWSATSLGANVPNSRYEHSSIWTGNEMIVWGGSDGGYLNTGGRYDPTNDYWTATSLGTNVPNSRHEHTAIWTGDEMIVWGGKNDVSYTNTGGRYDPTNDSWTATSLGANVPNGRFRHTAIWSGGEMIVWGGYGGSSLNTGGRYNPLSDNWMATSVTTNGPSDRKEHTAIWNGSEMIIWGGFNDNRLNSGGRYNPVTDNWTSTTLMSAPDARYRHTANWTGVEMIIWGGTGASPGNFNTGGRYNPIDDSWHDTSTINAPSPRDKHTSIWTGTEMIIWGGYSSNALLTGARYTPSTDTWVATPDAPQGRQLHTAIWTGSEMIVWGGSNYVNTGYIYNPSSGLWSSTSTYNAPSGRRNHTAVWDGNEMIIWGGNATGSTAYGTNTGGKYNPSLNSWTPTSTVGAAKGRYYHSAIFTGNEMIVWGGYGYVNGYNDELNSGGRYDTVLNTWTSTSLTNAPQPRHSQTAIWTGQKMMIWGGVENGSSLDSLGIYLPSNIYNVSGNLTGLNGDQVILQNNGGDDLTLTADGSFIFEGTLLEGSDYEVTVLTNPLSPTQTCTVTNGSGVNITSDVTDVAVNCVNDLFYVGVTVSGLAVGNSVFIENNGEDLMRVSDNNVLTNFSTQIGNGLDYLITFDTQPSSPNQSCSIAPGEETGTINSADVNVAVVCTTHQYNVNVNVSGLTGDGVSFSNGNDALTINSDGTQMLSALDDGTVFDVNITAQPSTPNQVCSFTNFNSGSLNGADYTVNVECVTGQYTVGGTLSGLESGNFVTLSMNSGDEYLALNSNASFEFVNPLIDGSTYNVTVLSNPSSPNQECEVIKGSGTLSGVNITDIDVICVIKPYFIGGYVFGLIPDNYMLLQNNLDDDLVITNEGAFVFNTPLDYQEDYDVTIKTQPNDPIQSCVTFNSSGTFISQDIENIFIYCEFGDDLIFRHGFDEPVGISQELWELLDWPYFY